MEVVIILKSGKEFTVECDNFTVSTSKLDGSLVSVEYVSAKNNIPFFLDMHEVAAIVRR